MSRQIRLRRLLVTILAAWDPAEACSAEGRFESLESLFFDSLER